MFKINAEREEGEGGRKEGGGGRKLGGKMEGEGGKREGEGGRKEGGGGRKLGGKMEGGNREGGRKLGGREEGWRKDSYTMGLTFFPFSTLQFNLQNSLERSRGISRTKHSKAEMIDNYRNAPPHQVELVANRKHVAMETIS